MVNYESVNITFDILGLVEVIMNVLVCHHWVSISIITDKGLLFISRFWFFWCYHLRINKKLSIVLHPQTNYQTEKQNSMMETYLKAFFSWKQNDWARLLSMTGFTYINAKNANTGHTLFEFNCDFYFRFWLNSKYIKIKKNRKPEKKLFGLFSIFYVVRKQAYKLKDIRCISRVTAKQDTRKKRRVNELSKDIPKPEREFETGNNEEYEVKAIISYAIYGQETNGQIPGLYYLVLWKDYLEE